MSWWLWYVECLLLSAVLSVLSDSSGTCYSTDNNSGGISAQGVSHETSLSSLKKKLMGCTTVVGNIVVMNIDDKSGTELTFLHSIRKVTGFVVVSNNNLTALPFPNLQIISGQNLADFYNDPRLALFVSQNSIYAPGLETIAGLNNLREVSRGEVLFHNNSIGIEAYVSRISWNDIVLSKMYDIQTQFQNFTVAEKEVIMLTHPCNESCTKYPDYCWGPGPDMCQDLNLEVCTQCDNRCFTSPSSPSQPLCCHEECAGGCTGQSTHECIGCRNFNSSGNCVKMCSPPELYDPKTYQNVKNPDVRYSLGSECLAECPAPYLIDVGNCVRFCSPGKMIEGDTNECIPCPNGKCPKTCPGIGKDEFPKFYENEPMKRCKKKKCIKIFQDIYLNCTTIQGNIDISAGFLSKLNSEQDLEVLESVSEVTGYVAIVSDDDFFTSLKFLRNLKTIKGRALKHTQGRHGCTAENPDCTKITDFYSALWLTAMSSSTLSELNLNSLQHITAGNVNINSFNKILCYVPSKESIKTISGREDFDLKYSVVIKYQEEACADEGMDCDDQCLGGCWGPGSSNCVNCMNLKYEQSCIESCELITGVYQTVNNTCDKCNVNCDQSAGCSGPESSQCNSCAHYKDGPYCVDKCPVHKYANAENICTDCHLSCRDYNRIPILEYGCTGNGGFIGPGGCNFCYAVIVMESRFTDNGQEALQGNCVSKSCDSKSYPDIYKTYKNLPTHQAGTQYIGQEGRQQKVKVCTPCNDLCTSCKSSGTSKYECECKWAIDDDMCVKDCGVNKYRSFIDKQCKSCDGDTCPTNCLGSESPLTGSVLATLSNCHLVEGSVVITEESWTGPDPISVNQLEALNLIQTINGRLKVVNSPDPSFTHLDMFRSLKKILGQITGSVRKRAVIQYALEINNNSALQTTELISLERVEGGVYLGGDSLCYADTVIWGEIVDQDNLPIINVDSAACSTKTCHEQCSDDGCWGPEQDMCISCKNKYFDNKCWATCEEAKGSFDAKNGSSICYPCHEACETCYNHTNTDCGKCKYVEQERICLYNCGENYYKEENKNALGQKNNICQKCHPACKNGCTGPKDHRGHGGCNSCVKHQYNNLNKTDVLCHHTCPPKYFEKLERKGTEVCKPCDDQCTECTTQGPYNCGQCLNVKQGDKCQESCDPGFYANQTSKECLKCDKLCTKCNGPSSNECLECLHFEQPTPNTIPTKKCVRECPQEYAYLYSDGNQCAKTCETDKMVVRDPNSCIRIPGRGKPLKSADSRSTIISLVVGALIVFIIVCIMLVCWKRSRQNTKKRLDLIEHAQKCHEKINPIYEPMVPEDIMYPVDREMLTVTEDALECGAILGSGAFGTVFEGRWFPTEDHKGLRVAIKILKESRDPETTKEFFDEAVVMARLDHKHLVRILCLCAGKMMLVTQLMPLGSLLDYVRKNKNTLSANQLLTYGYQIAKGMSYLETNNVVHRDLAARNVLVQTPTFVKITDFGLAKMLSRKEHTFTSEGGKLPIKWLAIESLKHRQFTSRSDTWSYGVTIWEVLEYGQLPWRTKRPADLLYSLDRGDRLKKPKVCTLEVYATMLRCWVPEPAARPNFDDLMYQMEEFLKEPNRYIHLNHRASTTEGSYMSPHASVTSDCMRDSGIVDTDRNYENDDRALAVARATYDATSSLKHNFHPDSSYDPHYDPALTADQDDVFSEPSTARNSIVSRHDYVQDLTGDYLVPDYPSDEGNGTDESAHDQGYVAMGGAEGQYTDLEQNPEDPSDLGYTRALLGPRASPKPSKNKLVPCRTPSPLARRAKESPKPSRTISPRQMKIIDDGYSCLKDPPETQPLTSSHTDL